MTRLSKKVFKVKITLNLDKTGGRNINTKRKAVIYGFEAVSIKLVTTFFKKRWKTNC